MIYLSAAGEKRSALLAEVTRLREERNSESGEAAGEDRDYNSQQPCRGAVSITNIQLPLKVEFVCSSHNRPGSTTDHLHYWCICMTSVLKKKKKKIQALFNTIVVVGIHFDLFMYPFRTAKSLLLCPDPLRPLQHRRHPTGHSCWCSEWRHHLFPYCCHSVSFSSSAGFWSLVLCFMHKFSAFTFSLFFWIDLKSFFFFSLVQIHVLVMTGHIQATLAELGHSFMQSFFIVSRQSMWWCQWYILY